MAEAESHTTLWVMLDSIDSNLYLSLHRRDLRSFGIIDDTSCIITCFGSKLSVGLGSLLLFVTSPSPLASRHATMASNAAENDNVYETTSSLNQYLMLHYPSSGLLEGVPSILPHKNAPQHGLRFPQRSAQALWDLFRKVNPSAPPTTSLDIGCAVGGGSFELARYFAEVDAFDYSENFIRMAHQMKHMQRITFNVPMEGEISETVVCRHESYVTPEIANRTNFFVGNACAMKEMMQPGEDGTAPRLKTKAYDAIILANLLCRLPDPMACLEALPDLLTDHGVVLILTPFTWMEEFTPRDKWLGGCHDAADDYENDDEDVSKSTKRQKKECWSRDGLQRHMERLGFVIVSREEMPLVIREHQRKYQYIISEATGWKKKP
jgi:putative 4-mercaptohistidine N1-methyltranferase